MQKVWIFGDSYAADASNESYAWPKRLAEKYDVRNWAQPGTGPNYQMRLFRKELESKEYSVNDLKDINLMFFISHDSRKDFSFFNDPTEQCWSMHIALETDNINDPVGIEKIKKYKKQKQFMKQFYQTYYLHNTMRDFDHLQYVGIIKEVSRFFKKVLVVPVFDHPHHGILHQKFDTTIEDYGNFSYSRGPALFNVEEEINGKMPNHLCVENHNLMLHQLTNWIEHSIPLDTDKLKKIR